MNLALDTYRLLGRSGLRVSPLALGTATFGTDWGWGADAEESRALLRAYVERGGNFIDTASTYTNGSAERFLGEFTKGIRERLVLATKYTTLREARDPNSGGPHRKSLVGSVESSLRRLRTDYIDLLYLHVWDGTTSVEEVMRGLDDLVRQGKVLYVAMSNVPAWQIARMQTLADLRGWSPLVALQIEYSLIERAPERDLIPMARELGLGIVPYSPLGGGILSGTYGQADLKAESGSTEDGTRRTFNRALGTITERNLAIADVVREIADELGRTPSQVGLAWLLRNKAVTAPIVGARRIAQFEQNLGSLDLVVDDDQLRRLDEASAIELGYPHAMLASDHIRAVSSGDLTIVGR